MGISTFAPGQLPATQSKVDSRVAIPSSEMSSVVISTAETTRPKLRQTSLASPFLSDDVSQPPAFEFRRRFLQDS